MWGRHAALNERNNGTGRVIVLSCGLIAKAN